MYRSLIYVMAYSGLRIGEASALQWKHLDLAGGWVHVRRAYKENGGELYLGTPKDDDIRDVRCLPWWRPPGSIGDPFFPSTNRFANLVRMPMNSPSPA